MKKTSNNCASLGRHEIRFFLSLKSDIYRFKKIYIIKKGTKKK